MINMDFQTLYPPKKNNAGIKNINLLNSIHFLSKKYLYASLKNA